MTPRPGDIVFTYEATLNRYAIIPEGFRGCLGRRLALIRPNPATVDTRYLFYSFFSKEWRDTIARNIISGATVERIPLHKFPEFPIRLPTLPVQRKIASTLTGYDDLIENNTRRIAILEEMARRIFEEWFVYFRAPGCEGLPRVDSPFGPIPKTWEVAPLESLCSRITDGAHHSPPSVAKGRPMLSVKDMRTWAFEFSECRSISLDDFDDLARNDCRPLKGDILVAKDGANLNKHTFLVEDDLDAVILSSIAILRPATASEQEFLVAALKVRRRKPADQEQPVGGCDTKNYSERLRTSPLSAPASRRPDQV